MSLPTVGMRCCGTCRRFRDWLPGEGVCVKEFDESASAEGADEAPRPRAMLWAARYGATHLKGEFDVCGEWSGFARADAEADGCGCAGELGRDLRDAAVKLVGMTEDIAFDAHKNPASAVKVTIRVEPGSIPTLAVEVEHPVIRREP